MNGAALSLPFGDVSSEGNGSQDADELDRESWLAIQQARSSVDRMNMNRTHVEASRPMSNTAFIHPFLCDLQGRMGLLNSEHMSLL